MKAISFTKDLNETSLEAFLEGPSCELTAETQGWLTKADEVAIQTGKGGDLLLHAKRRSRKRTSCVEAAVASEDV